MGIWIRPSRPEYMAAAPLSGPHFRALWLGQGAPDRGTLTYPKAFGG